MYRWETPQRCNDTNDCPSSDPYKEPQCPNNQCWYYHVQCRNDADCHDGDPTTVDKCKPGHPRVFESICVNAYRSTQSCTADSQCNDDNAYTVDSCFRGHCAFNYYYCERDAHCDDGDPSTTDRCVDKGGKICQHDAVQVQVIQGAVELESGGGVACHRDSDCSTSKQRHVAACEKGGTKQARCVEIPVVCYRDDECDDHDPGTRDVCIEPGTLRAACFSEASGGGPGGGGGCDPHDYTDGHCCPGESKEAPDCGGQGVGPCHAIEDCGMGQVCYQNRCYPCDPAVGNDRICCKGEAPGTADCSD